MIHPDTEVRYIDKETGYGVVATSFIPKGTITWVHDDLDRIYTQEEASKLNLLMKQHLETYCYTNHKGQKVLCWDIAKYVNHSFSPSCFSTAYDFEIAIRDILPGEQLTNDYGYLNLDTPFTPVDEGGIRKTVFPDDILTYHEQWDELLRMNIPCVFDQMQPLLPLIPVTVWEEFSELRSDPSKMRSIRHCHYDRSAVADVELPKLEIVA